ncbi:MAG TPA: branched-chain amino acid aminotransferase [Proteobacteria bacterium]|nr:branched-chain amino acid aminotransferase [Pseudomonadota bacterium]
MTNQDIYYIDGEFVEASKAVIPVNDLALLRGYGVFDFLRTYGGKPFCVEEHLFRLKNSARLIGLPFPWTVDEVIEIVNQTLALNHHLESNIRIIVTGGPSDDFITPGSQPRLLVLVGELRHYPPEWYSRGVKVITVIGRRAIPGAKTINYLSALVSLEAAHGQGAVEAISIDRDGKVGEGQTSTVFAFIGDRMVTNEDGILPGVTRELILSLTEPEFAREIREITISELLQAEEIFMTASNKEVFPVVRVDDTVISDGKPGPRTRRVMELFRDYTARFALGGIN